MKKPAGIFGFVYPILMIVSIIILFLKKINGDITQREFSLSMVIIAVLLILGGPGVIVPDRNGNALIYKARYQLVRLGDKISWFFQSRSNTRWANKVKQKRQKILAVIAQDGPLTMDAIIGKTNLPKQFVEDEVSQIIWYRWIEEVLSLNKNEIKKYVVTERGERQLANPGSTDHEEID